MGAPSRVLTWVLLLFIVFVLHFGHVEAMLGCHIMVVVMVSSSTALHITISLNRGRVKVG